MNNTQTRRKAKTRPAVDRTTKEKTHAGSDASEMRHWKQTHNKTTQQERRETGKEKESNLLASDAGFFTVMGTELDVLAALIDALLLLFPPPLPPPLVLVFESEDAMVRLGVRGDDGPERGKVVDDVAVDDVEDEDEEETDERVSACVCDGKPEEETASAAVFVFVLDEDEEEA
jgi:hypothetical protein